MEGEHHHHGDPRCSGCDPAAPRLMDQSAARFNDQSSFNVLAAQQNFILQQQANWMNLMKQQQSDAFTTSSQQLSFIKDAFGGGS